MELGRSVSPKYKNENILSKEDSTLVDISVIVKIPQLKDILRLDMKKLKVVDSLITQLKFGNNQSFYQAFYPLKRIKGKLLKVHALRLNSYSRYLYINPIEGVLISYNSANKFPLSPNYIIKLNEITDLRLMQDTWY